MLSRTFSLRSLRSAVNRRAPRKGAARLLSSQGGGSSDDEVDFVVVGAGSAGCVLARRLAEAGHSVAVLEAGKDDEYIPIHVPLGYLHTMTSPRTSWGFETTEQPGLNGRAIAYPRGKVLGGCSSINGMIYMRGQKADYDSWAVRAGGDSSDLDGGTAEWSWSDVLPFFERDLDYVVKRNEDGQDPPSPARPPSGGNWRVENQRLSWDILDTWADAAAEAGIPKMSMFHDSNAVGSGYFEVNQRGGWRVSSYRAFLKPLVADGKVDVRVRAHCKRILFEEGEQRGEGAAARPRATGVEYVDAATSNALRTVTARREVILCAGAVGSPHALLLSGLGPEDELRRHGIAPVEGAGELPGVGSNLQDHLQIRSVYELSAEAKTLNQMVRSPLGLIGIGMDYLLNRGGPLSMAPSQLGAFARSSEAVATPDLQYHVQPLSLDSWDKPLHPFPGITAAVCNLRPSSRGSVSLRSSDPLDKPVIDPNYLSTAEDRAVAVAGLRLTRKIMRSPAFAAFTPKERLPGLISAPDDDDEALALAAGDIGTSIFHPAGTCKMGTNPSRAEDGNGDAWSVVDARLRVFGVAGLRVADASIMPTITSGNTNSPSIMIGEKAASMVLEDHS